VLAGGDRDNLNLRAALLHVAGDLLGSAGAIVAALVILRTGWTPIDPILSVVVSVLILRSAWSVVRASGHILLEASPEGFDAAAIGRDLQAAVPELTAVRHLHAWSITENRPMVTLEAVRLADAFGFDHATVEICIDAGEPAAGPLPTPGCTSI
jgi:cobalt-zinc-cadmium efflux system protein